MFCLSALVYQSISTRQSAIEMVFKFIELHYVGWNNSSHPSWIAYYFACRRKVVHLCFIMSPWQNDICSFRAMTVALAVSFKLKVFNIYSDNNGHLRNSQLRRHCNSVARPRPPPMIIISISRRNALYPVLFFQFITFQSMLNRV